MIPRRRIVLMISMMVLTSFLLWTRTDENSPSSIGVSNSKDNSWAENYILENEIVRKKMLARYEHFVTVTTKNGKFKAQNWHYFHPTFTCPFAVDRVGSSGDGGKWICGIKVFENSKQDCIIYSFGVSDDSTFEVEMLERTNCIIYAYDPTVTVMNLPPTVDKSRVFFTQKGLGGDYNDPDKNKFNLGHFMRENGHEWIDFLKIDVEGWEFPAFKQISEEFGENFPFGHLNLEVHNYIRLYGKEDLEERFSTFYGWIEGGGMQAFKKEENPVCQTCNEYSFVNVNNKKNKLLQF